MHILALLVTVVAGAAFWFWRAREAATFVGEIGDAAGRLRGRVKRTMFRRKVEGSTLTGIDDPATAAAVFLVSVVESGRRMTPDDETAITRWLQDVAAEAKPDEALVFARWAVREVVDANEVVRRLSPLFVSRLTVAERTQLLEFARSLENAGEEAPAQREAFRRAGERFLPPEPARR